MPLRCRFDKDHLAAFGSDNQVTAGEQKLAIPIATALLFALTGLWIDAGQDRFVKTVHVAFEQN